MVLPEHVFSAAVNGRMYVLREYFASGDRDPNDTLERNGWTLLEGACAGKRVVEVVSPPGYPVQTRVQHVIKCEAVSLLLGQIGARMAFPRIVDREEHDLLVRVFAWAPAHRTDARRRTRSAQVHATASQSPLPRDVFKLVISFWAPSREVWWNGGYGNHCRDDARWIG